MPTYDYQCRECGHTIEVIHSMTESGPERCERCGGELRRVLFPAGIIFKGSGFYKTDSRTSGSSTSPSPAPVAKTASDADSKSTTTDSGDGGSGGTAAPAKDPPKKKEGA